VVVKAQPVSELIGMDEQGIEYDPMEEKESDLRKKLLDRLEKEDRSHKGDRASGREGKDERDRHRDDRGRDRDKHRDDRDSDRYKDDRDRHRECERQRSGDAHRDRDKDGYRERDDRREGDRDRHAAGSGRDNAPHHGSRGGKWDVSGSGDAKDATRSPPRKRERTSYGEERGGRRDGGGKFTPKDPTKPLCAKLAERKESEWAILPVLHYRKKIVDLVKNNKVSWWQVV
jgi:hypothetical protein